MKDILHRLLNKRGLTVETLDKEEKAQFDAWQATLTKDELTTEDIKAFIQSQLSVIETKWADYNLDKEKKEQLLPYFTVYKVLLAAINSPRSAREALEKNLTQLLNT